MLSMLCVNSRLMFDAAQTHIFLLMKKDTYSRFIRSDQYKNLLATAFIPAASKKKYFILSFQRRNTTLLCNCRRSLVHSILTISYRGPSVFRVSWSVRVDSAECLGMWKCNLYPECPECGSGNWAVKMENMTSEIWDNRTNDGGYVVYTCWRVNSTHDLLLDDISTY